ncbi:AAA family ATPase [Cognatishimia sp. F0-27]|uniref:chloramphenicol phosphotransferase CPT family protein n=1 Tax=Cognatishimia sp. F0-27 TaxID=2816855 RepID=UPI001D0CDB4B|nr:AAA family ATPase [Cognatishimia sp. F0-27]
MPVIVLNGASSSGKTTVAQAIQSIAEEPFWHLSIDHLRDTGVLPMQRVRSGDFLWSEFRERVFGGLHAMIGAVAHSGNPLIVEHILDTQRWIADLREILSGTDVLFVGLETPLDTLRAREQARGDRPIGMADADARHVHAGMVYDLRLDGRDAPERNAQRILAGFRSLPRISALSSGVPV